MDLFTRCEGGLLRTAPYDSVRVNSNPRHGLSATPALGLTLKQLTMLPSTRLKNERKIFPAVTKSSLMNLYLNQEYQNGSLSLTTNC